MYQWATRYGGGGGGGGGGHNGPVHPPEGPATSYTRTCCKLILHEIEIPHHLIIVLANTIESNHLHLASLQRHWMLQLELKKVALYQVPQCYCAYLNPHIGTISRLARLTFTINVKSLHPRPSDEFSNQS